MLIDTHCHLDSSQYFDDLDKVCDRAKEVGVESIIIPAALPEDMRLAQEISQRYDFIYFAAGAHPDAAHMYDRDVTKEFLSHPKCVAVGECGLDYYRIHATDTDIKELQKKVFIDQLELALECDKPLIIHIREATHDSFELIKKHAPKHKGVLHCYNAAHELLELSDSYYYGIGGVLTFKNARKLVEVFPKIPKNRVVIETDAPYLTPHPFRGERNEPSYTKLIAEKIAEFWECSYEEVCEITTQNAKELFSDISASV